MRTTKTNSAARRAQEGYTKKDRSIKNPTLNLKGWYRYHKNKNRIKHCEISLTNRAMGLTEEEIDDGAPRRDNVLLTMLVSR